MNDTKSDRTLGQLGLPPMELAESTTNGRSSRSVYSCVFSTLQKVFMLLLLITFSIGTYVLLLKLLENADNSRTTEIILVTGTKETANITLHKKDMEIFFQLYNKTVTSDMKRKKRSIVPNENEGQRILTQLTQEELARVKEILTRHRILCLENDKKHVCKELIDKLKAIIHRHDGKNVETEKIAPVVMVEKVLDKNLPVDHIKPVVSKKREAYPLSQMRYVVASAPVAMDVHPNMMHVPGTPALTDTCLLARLLKNKYPHVHGIYDNPVDIPGQHNEPSALPQMRLFPSSVPSYLHTRGQENHKPIVHPQDLDIFMSFLTQKPDILDPVLNLNSTYRKVNCPEGTKACGNNGNCIEEKFWCDGQVHCEDNADEINCNCKSRVDPSRVCDGYNDCPLGEDEMGCFGCSENMFSCEDIGTNSKSTCYTKEQRCNNEIDCPNSKDETDCNILAPSLLTRKQTMFAISSTEGFLHRNFKGDWYAVCQNPYMWAHDACRRETGLIIRPPFIQIVPIDPLEKVNYINTGSNSIVETSDSCFNHSAVYVTCPDFLCGTRVPTTSQLLKQNAENHLFGRNKRYSFVGFPYDPYNMIYSKNRFKRGLPTKDGLNQDDVIEEKNEDSSRKAESRVVGGKPSQPAAWPWMVAMYRDGMFHCGGVILTQSWIISAAHCVNKFWDHYYEIQVGMLRRFSFSPQEQIHRVTHVIVNQNYRQADMKNDLSLLRVEPSIQFSRWVRPICLPGANTAGPDWHSGPAPGTICTAVGWGATAEHGPDPDHMHEVEVPIWEHCKHEEDVAGREICAGFMEGGKDACQGDSGGPLLCRNPLNSQQWYLAGVVSHGDGCARKDEPGVYTRVSLFVKWIKFHTSSQSLPAIQPLQECPGYRCKSGILKCLPNHRKCDKIVDCLSAEDENNCDYSLFSSILEEKSPEKFSRHTESHSPKVESLSHKDDITRQTESKVGNSQDKENAFSINKEESQHITPTQMKEIVDRTELPDFISSTINTKFENASPFDMSKSTEESISISKELTTDNPSSNSDSFESSEVDRGDMQQFVATFSPETLESKDLKKNDKSDTIKPTEKPVVEFTTNVHDFSASDTGIGSDNSSDKLVIDFLPKFDVLSNDTDTDNTKGNSNIAKVISQSTSNTVAAKNLPEAESKSIIQNLEDLVSAELQPAARRKHNIPTEFQCRRIFQIVPFNQRCDHKADCEDGTDELECSCIDYLSAYNENLLCDGIFDCADGQDEIDCFSCPENHFLCRRSEICLPTKYVCDGAPQCPSGEDEFNCYALTNGREIFYDIDEKPKLNLEGYLTEKNKNDWQIVCDDNLTEEQQEQSAMHICHYLGFSSANRYNVKYVNIKDNSLTDPSRSRRQAGEGKPIHFAYRTSENDNSTARKVIQNPQLLKEECVPNVTKTCKSLYVYCDRSLFTDFILSGNMRDAEVSKPTKHIPQLWSWVAKVYLEGVYKCTGILVELSWVLIRDSCLWELSPPNSHITVVLGSLRTLEAVISFYERIHQVDMKKDLYRNRLSLLHLSEPAEYSNVIKPMIVSSSNVASGSESICVAVGQDNNNNTLSVFVKETSANCSLSNRCFVRLNNETICAPGTVLNRQWAGLVSCHNDQGWFPAASFVDSRGECDIGSHINATNIENLRTDIMYYTRNITVSDLRNTSEEHCNGVRCSRGRCMPLAKVCDGVTNCEDGKDETTDSCSMKHNICRNNPHQNGCECSIGQMKCRNGKCVSKELFGDGKDDCGDSTDEPKKSICSDYIARVMPSRLCDGVLHCHDKSDEDPIYCKCFAKKAFSCNSNSNGAPEYCVANDMVCDGVMDCPNGEDERTCIGLSALNNSPYGTGQVIIRSHGVWRSKCYGSPNHTKSELESICRELGFISGHAKEIKHLENIAVVPHNNLVVDQFVEVALNNQTSVKIRNTDEPIATPIVDKALKDCYPVFIECL